MGDLISRRETIEAVDGLRHFASMYVKEGEECGFRSGIAVAVRQLGLLPPTEPERMKLVREAVQTIMNNCKGDSVKDKAFRNAARFIQNAIDGSAPDFEAIVEPERKTGQWIEFMEGWGKCPFCGNQVEYPNQEWNNFCGQCGADMRGGQDG